MTWFSPSSKTEIWTQFDSRVYASNTVVYRKGNWGTEGFQELFQGSKVRICSAELTLAIQISILPLCLWVSWNANWVGGSSSIQEHCLCSHFPMAGAALVSGNEVGFMAIFAGSSASTLCLPMSIRHGTSAFWSETWTRCINGKETFITWHENWSHINSNCQKANNYH